MKKSFKLIAFTITSIAFSANAASNEIKPKNHDVENIQTANVIAGDIEAGKSTFEGTCVGCHGMKGEGGVGPVLNSQKAVDIADKLNKYKNGEQIGPLTSMMAPMAAGLSESDINNIATYMESLNESM